MVWTWRDKNGGGVYAPPSETGVPHIAMYAMCLREALPWPPQIWIRGNKRRIYLDVKKDVDAWFDYGPDPVDLETADAPYDGKLSVNAGSPCASTAARDAANRSGGSAPSATPLTRPRPCCPDRSDSVSPIESSRYM